MNMIAIELHDTGVAAFDESGLVLPPDPGYALIEGEELLTGHAALGRGRLKPRRGSIIVSGTSSTRRRSHDPFPADSTAATWRTPISPESGPQS